MISAMRGDSLGDLDMAFDALEILATPGKPMAGCALGGSAQRLVRA
jgi:hypothetical protein